MRAGHLLLVLGAFAFGCGGGTETKSPVTPQPSATAPEPTPTASEEAKPPPPAAPPIVETAKKTLTGLADAQVAHDAKRTAALYTEDAVLTTPAPAGRATITGRDAIEKSWKDWYAGIANPRFGFSRVWIASDGTVITEWVSTFKHLESGKLAGVVGLSVATLTPDGLVKSEHRYYDTVTIAGQVGISKAKVRPMVVNVPSSAETFVAKDGDEKNIEKAKAMYAAVEKHSETDFLAVVDEHNPVHENFAHSETVRGIEAAKQELAEHGKALPDVKIKVDGAWGVGDFAIAEVTVEGTFAPAKKPVKISSVDVVKIKDGRVKHVWSWADRADLLLQIGEMKPPATPKPSSGKK
jgi:ketosteroid isomerase-like protein/predicted ester cyclase